MENCNIHKDKDIKKIKNLSCVERSVKLKVNINVNGSKSTENILKDKKEKKSTSTYNIRTENKNYNNKIQHDNQKESKCVIVFKSIYYLFYGQAISYHANFKYSEFFENKNQTSYQQLNTNLKNEFEKYIQDIINVDPCFGEVLKDPYFTEKEEATRDNYINFIKKNPKYYIGARTRYFLKFAFIIAYLVLRILIFMDEYSFNERNLNKKWKLIINIP